MKQNFISNCITVSACTVPISEQQQKNLPGKHLSLQIYIELSKLFRIASLLSSLSSTLMFSFCPAASSVTHNNGIKMW